MQLEPGPIPQLAPTLPPIVEDQMQFTALTTDIFVDLDSLGVELDVVLGDLAGFDVPPEFDNIDNDLSTVDEALNELGSYQTEGYLDYADQAVTLSTGQFNLVAADVPGEVWNPVPAPQSGGATGGSQPGVQGPTSITIQNLTAPGDPNYYSGDQFEIDVQVTSSGGDFDFANLPINLTRSLNGTAQGELAIGSTDQFGRLVYQSRFDDSSIGARVFGVDPPGYSTNPTVSITVLAGPRPGGAASGPGAGGAAASLDNLTSGDSSTFHVGDVYRFRISGPAGQPVFIDQVKNGADLGETFVGSTDATGQLTFAGTISAASIGAYVETYRVGSVAVPESIQFVVVA